MYKEYFGFREPPFSIAPDPRFLYMSGQHREALAHLIFGLNSDGGFVMLTGEVGTGKTTVCRCLLEQVPPDTRTALVINPKITVAELLATVCDEFGIAYPRGNESVKVFVDLINGYLLEARAAGARAVLIIDEAQNLQPEVLEQLRLLTNLETSQEKLLQIILLGQPELRSMLSRPELRQLNQRITARYHLGPLAREDVAAYVAHRLGVAGTSAPLFPASTIGILRRLSGGIPRLINVLCDRALIGAYVEGRTTVTPRILAKAAREVFGDGGRRAHSRALPWLMAGLAAALAALVVLGPWRDRRASGPPAAPATTSLTEAPGPAPARTPPAADTAPADMTGDTLAWLFGQQGKDGEDRALRELFALWGVDYRAGDGSPASRRAEDAGLMLYAARGGLGDLRRLNRPAVLKLVGDGGSESWVTVTGLEEGAAVIAATGDTRRVPLIWFGEYALLWRPPPGYRSGLLPGAESPLVPWLERKLAARPGSAYRPRGAAAYDAELAEEVRRFQREEGLAVDGIAGPQTLMRLDASGEGETPLLAGRE